MNFLKRYFLFCFFVFLGCASNDGIDQTLNEGIKTDAIIETEKIILTSENFVSENNSIVIEINNLDQQKAYEIFISLNEVTEVLSVEQTINDGNQRIYTVFFKSKNVELNPIYDQILKAARIDDTLYNVSRSSKKLIISAN